MGVEREVRTSGDSGVGPGILRFAIVKK